jgi:hypothetical protein
MTLPQVYDLFEYWQNAPPDNEMLAMLAAAFTTWRPNTKPMTDEEHQASLEARWKAGAMNVKQMYEMMGGVLSQGVSQGDVTPMTGAQMPGIGPFPAMLP